MTTSSLGEEGFRWFLGIVEDINDPLMLGRVKVRVLDEYDEGIASEDIEWAHMLMPNTSESSKGIGDTPGLAVGSNIVGFFLDSQEKQIMMVLGSFPTIPEMDDDKHSISYLARGKQTLTKEKLGPEPDSSYAAQYPFNRVIQTKSGHVIELDDTPENERIHIYHKSGSYVEISADGRMVTKSLNDNFDIVSGNKIVYSKGTITLDATESVKIKAPGGLAVVAGSLYVDGSIGTKVGATGTFTSATGQIIHVQSGIITLIE